MFWQIAVLLNLIFTTIPAQIEEFQFRYAVVSAAPQDAQSTGAKVPQAWDVSSIQWQVTSPDGQKWAVLEGRSDVSGQAFTYAAFLPAGVHEHHWHSSEARVVVLRGVLKVNFGEHLDLQHLTSYPVGTYVFVPANVKHTMAADVDTIIIGTAVGPWHTSHHDAMSHDHGHQ